MKISILFISVFSALSIFGQTTIPNGNFENWQNVGNNDEEPTSWNSNKTGGGSASLGPQTCYRDGNAQSGSYCLKVETKSFFGTPVNGSATTGKIEAPSTNPADGYIRSVLSDGNFNSTFTGRPDSLVGYYKYNSAGNDQPLIKVMLHGNYDYEDPDQGGSSTHTVAVAQFVGPASSVSGWTRFAVPFTYSSTSNPQYILAVATSSVSQTNGQQGSILWVDNLSMVYCTPSYGTDVITACGEHTWLDGNTYTSSNNTATHTLVNSVGCDSIVTLDLTILPAPDVNVNVSGNVYDVTQSGATYQWLDCANGFDPIVGETNPSIINGSGMDLAVEITVGTCVDTSYCSAGGFSSILEFERRFGIYPNPVVDELYISGDHKELITKIEICSIDGKVLESYTTSSKSNISSLPSGTYFVRIYHSNGVESYSLIK